MRLLRLLDGRTVDDGQGGVGRHYWTQAVGAPRNGDEEARRGQAGVFFKR